jgi:hypothetical protein
MKTIHEQINALPGDVAGAYEANFFPREIAIYQQALRNLLAVWDQLRLIQAEGPVEVTVRSRTTSVTLGIERDLGATIVQDLHEALNKDAHRISGLIERFHGQLVREGESTGRIKMLELLLTPVGPDGKALPAAALSSESQGPFLSTPTPSAPIPTESGRTAA